MTNNTTLYQLNTISDTEVLKNAPCLLPGISFQKCQLSGPNLVRKKHNYTDFESRASLEWKNIELFFFFVFNDEMTSIQNSSLCFLQEDTRIRTQALVTMNLKEGTS